MLNSKYSSTAKSNDESGVKRFKLERTQKYGLDELHKKLGLEQPIVPFEYKEENRPPLNGSNDENMHFDEDMMDLDEEKDVSFVSDLILDHRNHRQENQYPVTVDVGNTEKSQRYDYSIKKSIFVVDTNFIVSHLNTLEMLRNLSSKFNHQILIPTTVIQELDGLKNSKKVATVSSAGSQSLGKLARAANDWIYRNLANLDSAVIGQKISQRYNYHLVKDDSILECCIYFTHELHNFVVLLSNDKNLCLRALTEQLLTVSYREGMSAELIASKVYEENLARQQINENATILDKTPEIISDRFRSLSLEAFNDIKNVVIEEIDKKMSESYGNELEYISYEKTKMIDFSSVGLVIYTHYISVFSEFFGGSTLKKDDWKNLPSVLTSVPGNPVELKSFVTFWCRILEELCANQTDAEWESIRMFTNNWLHACSSLNSPI